MTPIHFEGHLKTMESTFAHVRESIAKVSLDQLRVEQRALLDECACAPSDEIFTLLQIYKKEMEARRSVRPNLALVKGGAA